MLNRKSFDFDKKLRNIDLANLIFFSKKYNKGILTVFEQSIEHDKKSVYNINLCTGAHGNYMFISSMIIVDKDFNYDYLMNYLYIHLPHDRNVFMNRLTIQDIKNYCNLTRTDIKGNAIYENIDDILSNIYKINTNDNKYEECNPITSDADLKSFFPKKIDKDGPVYYKK
ncbi:hypothetical protein [Chryseobacterium gregarium]|uniref:hypothetical protein n=1 Tax=Chryseobacterium gregarium TaxID=456299 RepID=UPI0004826006|nr:hypothetical protein [Chryseobacterium gregarium]